MHRVVAALRGRIGVARDPIRQPPSVATHDFVASLEVDAGHPHDATRADRDSAVPTLRREAIQAEHEPQRNHRVRVQLRTQTRNLAERGNRCRDK